MTKSSRFSSDTAANILTTALPKAAIPLALLFACLLAYGPLILRLGFYWDDWPTLWFLNRFGPSVFTSTYGIDRPALGWLFAATTWLVGESPLAWQVFGILTRWLACVSLWTMLRAVWPQNAIETAWVAFLFAVYPGFTQQPIAFTYSADWIAIALFFFSFWLMIVAVRKPKWGVLMILASLLLAAYVMFADEYYFGLELLRPVFLWIVLGERGKKSRWRLGQVALRWAPYLAVMAIFLYWRLVIFVSPRGQVQIIEQMAEYPGASLLALVVKILTDMFQSSLVAWSQILDLRYIKNLNGIWLPLYAVLTILATLLAVLYFKKSAEKAKIQAQGSEPSDSRVWARQAILIGVYALFVGGWPFWVTNLPIELYFPWDRFNLAMMLGASLLLAGLIVWLARTAWQRALVLGIILGLAFGFHFYNADRYRQDWNLQKEFFWQLTWRAPQIQTGTILLTADLPFRYYSDNSLTAPLNLTYAPEETSFNLPYILFNAESRLGGFALTDLKKGLPINQPYRTAMFSGNTSKMIVLFYDPPRCLKVIDPSTDLLLPRKPIFIGEAAPLSNPSLIESTGGSVRPPEAFFGSEPLPNWCYYFEKAELARQLKDWQEVARLGDLALELPVSINRSNASELITYIQGYAMNGELQKAVSLTRQAVQSDPKLADMLCPIWYDIHQSQNDLPEAQNAYQEIVNALDCTFSQ